MNGPGSQLSTSVVAVGSFSTGSLAIGTGGLVSDAIGSIAANGSVVVSGPGSQWTNSSNLSLGGSLTIQNGGLVSDGFNGPDGNSAVIVGGAAVVDGGGSSWTNSGWVRVQDGSLTVQNGGTVTSTNTLSPIGAAGIVGRLSTGVGTATVTGAGSEWTLSGGLIIGQGGFGPGGAPHAFGGNGSPESFGGSGSLLISAGGKIVSSEGVVGFNSASNGVAIVTGAGSEWKANGAGTSPSGGSFVDPCVASSGVSGNLYVGAGGLCNQVGVGSGLLTVSDFGRVTANTLFIGATGTVNGDGGFIDATVENEGLFTPGLSPGTLTVNGDFFNRSGGVLLLEIAGIDVMDHLIINGDATFDIGSLIQFSFLNGFLPSLGQTFSLISITGATNLLFFMSDPANFEVLGLPPGFRFSSDFTGGLFSLRTDLADAAPVPEPASLLLLASGLAAILARQRARRRDALNRTPR